MMIIEIQMYNKSREKLVAKPPLATRSAIRPPLKETQSTLPSIKANKQPTASSKKITTSAAKNRVDKSVELAPKPPARKMQIPKRPATYAKPSQGKDKENKEKVGWGKLPLNILLQIGQFCCAVPVEVYNLSLVCLTWRQLMSCQNGVYFWTRFPKTQKARNFSEFKACLQSDLLQLKQKRSVQFQTMFTKLFNYGSTKENIPNKLISKLKLEVEITINKRRFALYPYKMRNFNFSSYLYTKVNELKDIEFDLYSAHNFFKDNLQITVTFYSRTFKVSHRLAYKFQPAEIGDCAIRQKAFNYFIAKNLIITFFQGDKNFLYCFLQISVLELITEFRKTIKASFQQHIDKKTKKVPLYKKLCETEFQNFVEYLKFQADFELHMSYHNSVRQIFTHCDTKVYPLEYNEKSAYFDVKINDTFEKTSTFMLDNKMGMSEKIEDLYLLDFVLKDRDRFLIVFSGFIYARNATQQQRESIDNFFEFAENPMKILEFKAPKYNFSILIIEEKKKNFIKHTRFYLYP